MCGRVTLEGDFSQLKIREQSFENISMRGVHYTSEITEDTHRHYVTAKPEALMAPEAPK